MEKGEGERGKESERRESLSLMIWVAHRRVLACHLKVAFVAARAHSAKGIWRKSMPFLVFQHCNVYRFSGISSKCHPLFFPLFGHDQKSDNISRCLIGRKQAVPKKIGAAARRLAENVSSSHDISQAPHGTALRCIAAIKAG